MYKQLKIIITILHTVVCSTNCRYNLTEIVWDHDTDKFMQIALNVTWAVNAPVFLWRAVRQVGDHRRYHFAAPSLLNLHGKPQLHAHIAALRKTSRLTVSYMYTYEKLHAHVCIYVSTCTCSCKCRSENKVMTRVWRCRLILSGVKFVDNNR